MSGDLHIKKRKDKKKKKGIYKQLLYILIAHRPAIYF